MVALFLRSKIKSINKFSAIVNRTPNFFHIELQGCENGARDAPDWRETHKVGENCEVEFSLHRKKDNDVRMVAVPVSAIAFIFLIMSGGLPHPYGQAYPAKPIRLLVGFPPGGGVDVIARQIAPRLGEQLGRQVVVENHSGAGTNISSEMLANAAPDGYTLLLATASIAINPDLYDKVAFDPVTDFAPVNEVGMTSFILVVHPSFPAKSVKELIAVAKAKPGKLTYASAGNGSVAHLAGELFKSMTGTKILHVPFRGNPPSMIALMSGEVDYTFGTLPATLSHIKSGKLRMLAVSSAKRSAFIPELVTVSESGIPGYDVTQWYGMVAPARTPAAIIARLDSELIKVLAAPDIKAQLANQSLEITMSTPQQFAAFIKSERVKWAKVIKESKIRVD
jgi:tripartite-type tricarboxylate transporter receptor subunit TctC